MIRWLSIGGVVGLFLAYPFLIDRLDESDRGPVAPVLVALLLLCRAGRVQGGSRWLLAGLGFFLALGSWILGAAVSRWIPPVAFLFVAWGFGRTLFHPPSLIERMVRLQYPEIPPYLQRYLFRLTWLWCVTFLLLAVISVALSLAGASKGWLWFHALGIYLVMAVLIMGEYAWRRWRFRELGKMPLPHETFIAVAREGRKLWQD